MVELSFAGDCVIEDRGGSFEGGREYVYVLWS